MPLLVHAVLGPYGVHGAAVEHARLADREVRDVDHLLDFTQALRLDLAVLQRDQGAEIFLRRAQRVAQQAYGFATAWRGHVAPGGGRLDRAAHHGLIVRDRGAAHLGERLARGRIDRRDARAGDVLGPAETPGPGAGVDGIQAQALEDAGDVHL